jgi:iron complex transport system substrate-binding protein
MNLCTDQLAMLLARPGQLVAVSRIASDPLASALWREAAAYPAHNGQAEAIHGLAPDLVLAGTWDPPATLDLLRRLGHRIETFGIEAGFDDIRANVARMGALLGAPDRAAALVAAMDRTLAAPPADGPRPRAALFYANGYTSGAGTLAHEILEAAGFANIAAELGRRGLAHLPLELLVMQRPDLLVTGQDYPSPALAQGVLRHPATRALAAGRAEVADNLWVCGTPLAAQAVAALRAARPE